MNDYNGQSNACHFKRVFIGRVNPIRLMNDLDEFDEFEP